MGVRLKAVLLCLKPNLINGEIPRVYCLLRRVAWFEPPQGKTNNLHRRKQRRRTAKLISAFFRYTDSTTSLRLAPTISSF